MYRMRRIQDCRKGFVAAALLGLASCAAPLPPAPAQPARAEAARPAPPSRAAIARPEPPSRNAQAPPEIRPSETPRARLELHDADLKTVLLALAEQAGVSIVLPGDIDGTVTCVLEDVSCLEALHAVAATAGYVVVHEGLRRP